MIYQLPPSYPKAKSYDLLLGLVSIL